MMIFNYESRKFQPKKLIAALSVASLCFIYSQAVDANVSTLNSDEVKYGEMAPSKVSESTWQIINNWSTDKISLLEYAFEENNPLVDEYVEVITRKLSGRKLLRQFKAIDKQVLAFWKDAYRDKKPKQSYYLIRYMLWFKPDVFNQWLQQQQQPSLTEFVKHKFPNDYQIWLEQFAAPKTQGLSLLNFDPDMDEQNHREIMSILSKRPLGGEKSVCSCQMILPSTTSGTVVTNYPATPWSSTYTDNDNSGMKNMGSV
ncbi:hypothetical protein [Shewanella marina]|uniref:hypothetical protein n=1 Tax=Shewanella marina TaxID=487319 RepID=UPI0011DD5345|nr:hypothetical protein [Shewanella marina]